MMWSIENAEAPATDQVSRWRQYTQRNSNSCEGSADGHRDRFSRNALRRSAANGAVACPLNMSRSRIIRRQDRGKVISRYAA